MNAIPTTPPSGFRDFLPDACAIRAKAVERISATYRSFGFQQIATSAVEDLAVLTGKGGGDNEKLIFKLLKRGEKLDEARAAGAELADLGLRFDLTLPLARYYSKYGSQLPHPFKAFHIGPVWRAERAQKGRYREFYQCDVDVLGCEHSSCEIEVITAVLTAFEAVGLTERPTTVINDRELLLAILEKAGVAADQTMAACIELDKLDKTSPDAVLVELEKLAGASATKFLERHVVANTGNIGDLEAFNPAAAMRIRAIVDAVNEFRPGSAAFSAKLIRGFDYYTGPVFEFRSPKLSGSLGGGGRYDRLTEKFGGQKTAACGGSIGFERLLLLLEEQGTVVAEGPDACVTVFSEDLRAKTIALAGELRRSGLAIDVYPGMGKLKAQFKYADAKKAAYAVVLGPEEDAVGQAKLKNLRTGEERSVTLESLAVVLRQSRQQL